MKKIINFALIGYGRIGKKHAKIIQKNERCNLAAIVDINNNLRSSDKISSTTYFNSLKDLFKSNVEIDVAVIATPNNLHSSNSLECLSNNCHIVVEKPMALTKIEAEKIIRKSNEVKKNVFVVMQNRFSPPLSWIKKILDKKILGKIYLVQLSCFWNRDNRYYKNHDWHGKKDLDGGTLFTQFSHYIDLLYWLFGDITNIVSKLKNFNHNETIEFEDSGFITFDFKNGGSGAMNYSTSVAGENFESSLSVIAQNGTIKIGGQYMDKLEYCNIKEFDPSESLYLNSDETVQTYKGSSQNHYYIYENVINVLNNNIEIKTGAFDGMKVTEIIEKIYENSNLK